ncbi:MAG: pyridoxal-phosphate dependent enzyme, partial [Deltaproteobacteria bacterium]|nr:pyridoxal-phosphate dependent enzyme [Deltaproteobacteria bacterium]
MDSRERFFHARDVLRPIVVNTPLLHSASFSAACGNDVYFKPENMQLTGAYKIRGAYYKIAQMGEAARARGLVTSSAGNHAQGVAYAAKCMGAKAIIVMPTTTPLVKVNNTKKHGATVILAGDGYDEAYARARSLEEQEGCTFVHPFNDLDIATGQGTVAVEILEEMPDTDIILVPIGGGGLAAGVSTFVKLMNPKIRVVGVEPKGAACMAVSLQKGEVSSLAFVDTIADGVAVKTPGDKIFPFVRSHLDEIILVDDAEIPNAFLDMTEHHKMVVENAGLISVAALKHLNVT